MRDGWLGTGAGAAERPEAQPRESHRPPARAGPDAGAHGHDHRWRAGGEARIVSHEETAEAAVLFASFKVGDLLEDREARWRRQ